jgi:hypothetical protein
LHLTSIVSIVLVMSGYYVVLPRRWRRRWEERKRRAAVATEGPPGVR